MKSFSVTIRTLCSAIFFYTYLLHSMECTKEHVLSAEQDKVVWEAVINDGIAWFDYAMIGSLVINKKFEEILLNTSKQREQYLNGYDYCLSDMQYNEWYRYSSVRGKVAFKVSDKVVKYIWLERQCLLNPMQLSCDMVKGNFYGKLPHQPKPFFNKQGYFCFYGYGEIERLYDKCSGAVVEYSLCADNKKKVMECIMCIKNKKPAFPLRIFLEFPNLLKAFLNSSCTYETTVMDEQNKNAKIFTLKGVTIPKNYKFHQQYFPKIVEYLSFDDLPKIVRKKIMVLYEKQRLKKKKENGVGCFGK